MSVRIVLFVVLVIFAAASWVFSCEADRLQNLTERVAILEPRTFEQLTVVAAGTGAAQEDPERLGPVIAVGAASRVVLVDAGRAAPEALRKAKISLVQPDTVFLTSLLPENVAGLGELLVTGFAALRETPLRVVGPPGTKALVEGLVAAYASSLAGPGASLGLPAGGARLEALEVGDGWSEEAGGMVARAASLPGGPFPALAWRFESGGRSATIVGVGFGADAAATLARETDLLVHEATYGPTLDAAIAAGGPDGERLAKESAIHAGAVAAGDVAARAGARKLVLVRLRPPPLHHRQYTELVRERFEGPVLVAEEGDEVTR